MQTGLEAIGHSQPPTPVATDNTATNSIVMELKNKNISRAIDMIFYWVKYIILQNNLHILLEEGKKTRWIMS